MIRALGDDALLVACGGGPIRHRIARALAASGTWAEVVPGREDVAVVFDLHAMRQSEAMDRLAAQLKVLPDDAGTPGTLHKIPVVFGGEAGPDLDRICAENAVSAEALLSVFLEAGFSVDLIGFTPGFAYLTGLPGTLNVDRLSVPRVKVPAGSIGIITGQVGLYALEGPGGWPLIGRAQVPLFDPSSDKPFRLQPGDRVRFVLGTGE